MEGSTAPEPGAPDTTGTGTPPAPPAQQPPAGPAPTTQPQGQKSTPAEDVASLPEWAQKLIGDTRSEAAKHRTEKQTVAAQAQEVKRQRDAMLAALGLTPDGKNAPPTTDALTKQIDDYKAQVWEQGAQTAILRVARDAGADADALLDSNTFLDSLAEFVEDDPTTPDFRAAMSKHIKAFVAKHPKLALATATQPPGRSGGDFGGGPGGPAKKAASLEDAIAARYAQ